MVGYIIMLMFRVTVSVLKPRISPETNFKQMFREILLSCFHFLEFFDFKMADLEWGKVFSNYQVFLFIRSCALQHLLWPNRPNIK